MKTCVTHVADSNLALASCPLRNDRAGLWADFYPRLRVRNALDDDLIVRRDGRTDHSPAAANIADPTCLATTVPSGGSS